MEYQYSREAFPGSREIPISAPNFSGLRQGQLPPLFGPQTGFWGMQGMGRPLAAYDPLLEERQSFEDARRMQSYYPKMAQQIQEQVEEACDKMEYEGSIMFDEHPDRLMMRRTARGIVDQIKEKYPEEWGQEETLAVQSMGKGRPPRKRDDWLGDLVQVMLADEMHRRRCRHRRCRRRIW